jgi:hypothetical protein
MGKNLFFFHHTHAEGSVDEESLSKYNTFEVILAINHDNCLFNGALFDRSR